MIPAKRLSTASFRSGTQERQSGDNADNDKTFVKIGTRR